MKKRKYIKRNCAHWGHKWSKPLGAAIDRDTKTFLGRYKGCERCGCFRLFRGVTDVELTELVETTIKDMPKDCFPLGRLFANEKTN